MEYFGKRIALIVQVKGGYMKKTKSFILFAVGTVFFLVTFMNACRYWEPYGNWWSDCGGLGWVKIENNSSNTVHMIYFNGDHYGNLEPGEKRTFVLEAGTYTLEWINTDGNKTCQDEVFLLSDCEIETFSCSL